MAVSGQLCVSVALLPEKERPIGGQFDPWTGLHDQKKRKYLSSVGNRNPTIGL
jgi:hypothetical protein